MVRNVTFELGHTCMNHFAVLDCRDVEPPSDTALWDLATTLCSTPLADDMLVLQSSDRADVRMRVIGGDRREGDFCGNGTLYTAAKIGAELQRDNVTVETAIGVKEAVNLGCAWKIEVGPVIPLDRDLEDIDAQRLDNKPVYGLLRAGEPHLVMFRPPEIAGFHVAPRNFEDFCRPLRDASSIAGGISITMVFNIEFRSVLVRTYERAARRHTFSCGTGSVSAVAAVFGTPSNGSHFHVCAPGGAHEVSYERDRWYLAALPQPIGIGRLEDDIIHLPLGGLLPYRYSGPAPRLPPGGTCR